MAERTEELQKKSPALPSAAQVIAYLRRHPDFLYRHPELLDIQTPPARHNEGPVVDRSYDQSGEFGATNPSGTRSRAGGELATDLRGERGQPRTPPSPTVRGRA